MLRSVQMLTVCLLLGLFAAPAEARIWKDITGRYTLEADLIGFDNEMVILQRKNKELGSCPIDKLSKEDREYLKSKEATEIHEENLGSLQTWTMKSGLKVVGRVVDYARREVTLQRRRGKTYVNSTVYRNLPEVYQNMLVRVVEHLESIELGDQAGLERWVRSLRGEPQEYTLDGVIFELENGDEYGIPFFLFSPEDQKALKPGWEVWLADLEDSEREQEHSLRLQSQAAAYQKNQQFQRQVAMINMQMQAIQTGLTSAWEVTLYPVRGNPNPPRWVVTMGRNSEIATRAALAQYPGYVSGPVRKVSR